MPEFRSARDLLPRALELLERERAALRGVVDGTLELTGGTSVPGALTGGDVDLHLRVRPGQFAAAVEVLRRRYRVVHPEIWCETLATFELPEDRVGVAATPIGSEHDRRFVSAWTVLRTDASALDAYNEMKRAHAGDGDGTYLAAKAAFFDRLAERGASSSSPAPTPGHQSGPPYAEGESMDDQRAIERYRYMLQTAPPEDIERAHEEAFERLSPEQRAAVLRQLSDRVPAADIRGDDPRSLARTATRAEMREPGTMERTFGGAGAPGLGSMFLSTLAGAFVGSSIANAFFAGDGGDGGDGSGDAADGGDSAMNDDGGGDGGDYGGDGGGDFGGDFGGGDFGGGDIGF